MNNPVSKRQVLLALAAIVGLGAFLRFHDLGKACLWIDEITFVSDSNMPTPGMIWDAMIDSYRLKHQPALPRIIEWTWIRSVRSLGFLLSEAVYRMPAAILGTVSIAVVFLLGRRLFNPRVGLFAAILVSTSFYPIYYSRDAYNYSPFLFCALLSWYCLEVILANVRRGQPSRARHLVAYGLAAALALQMLMAGIVCVASQLAYLVWMAWSPPLRQKTAAERVRLLGPAWAAGAVAWVPFLPFLWQLRSYASADEGARQAVSVGSFLKMLGEMGWSSHPVPWLIFLGCISAGAWSGFRDPDSRGSAFRSLWFGLSNLLAIGFLERMGRYETRYFIPIYPVVALFAAAGLDWLAQSIGRKLWLPLEKIGWAVLGAAVLAWNIPFYFQLDQLHGKLFCSRAVAVWMVTHTPLGATYVLDSSYLLRELPGFYPTPGRYGAAPPAVFTTSEKNRTLLAFFKDLARRFPDSYFIDTQHAHFDDPNLDPQAWYRTSFRRHARIENPALIRLFRMGIFPSGAFYPDMADPAFPNLTTDIYWNSRDDLVESGRRAGDRWLAFFGPEWVHCEVTLPNQGWAAWKGIRSEGRISVLGLQPQPARMQVGLRCASYQVPQTIVVSLQGKGIPFSLPADQNVWLGLGEMDVQPGENEIVVRRTIPQLDDKLPKLLVYEIRLLPAPPK